MFTKLAIFSLFFLYSFFILTCCFIFFISIFFLIFNSFFWSLIIRQWLKDNCSCSVFISLTPPPPFTCSVVVSLKGLHLLKKEFRYALEKQDYSVWNVCVRSEARWCRLDTVHENYRVCTRNQQTSACRVWIYWDNTGQVKTTVWISKKKEWFVSKLLTTKTWFHHWDSEMKTALVTK